MLLAPMFITPIASVDLPVLLNDQIGAIPHTAASRGVDYDFFGPGKALFKLALIDVCSGRRSWCCSLRAWSRSRGNRWRRPESTAPVVVRPSAGTLPLLAPVLVVAILLRCLDAMKVFEYVFATTRGGPGTETQTLQYFVYQTGIQFFRSDRPRRWRFIVLLLVLTVIVVAFRRMDKAKQS